MTVTITARSPLRTLAPALRREGPCESVRGLSEVPEQKRLGAGAEERAGGELVLEAAIGTPVLGEAAEHHQGWSAHPQSGHDRWCLVRNGH